MTDYRDRSVALLKSIETGDPTPRAYLNHDHYTQHNIAMEDGVGPVLKLFDTLLPGQGTAHTVRAFQDGAYVFLHSQLDIFGAKVVIDIHRYADGLIVEHWDNMQPAAARPNASGRSMTDGATEITDRDKTAANKALIRNFLADLVIARSADPAAPFFDGDTLLQHNPQLGDGAAAFLDYLGIGRIEGGSVAYRTLHSVLGEGNFVLALSEGVANGQPAAFFDLFRIAGGKIAEHWDVVDEIPPVSEHKNPNGKF